MNRRTMIGFAIALLLLASIPLSLSVLAESEDPGRRNVAALASDTSETQDEEVFDLSEETIENEIDGYDRDEFDREDEFWEDDEEDFDADFDEEGDDEHDRFERFEHARELACLAESQASTLAYTIGWLIESTDEEDSVETLEQILATTHDTASRRLIAVQLAELYAELDQPAKIRQLLIELTR